ncbi:hypothetical protein A2U01_0087467, partial [Trifolium medium]|nr:hypothetical protein [Trifolium medium]
YGESTKKSSKRPDRGEEWINLVVVEETPSLIRKIAQLIPSRRGVNDVNLSMLIDKIFDVLDQSSQLVKPRGLSKENINTM